MALVFMTKVLCALVLFSDFYASLYILNQKFIK